MKILIIIIASILTLYGIRLFVERDRKHPCIQYGEEKQSTYIVIVGNIGIPSTTTSRECLKRYGE